MRRVNQMVFGDQYAPRIARQGSDLLMVWTSIGQDGSAEGIYGRFMDWNGAPTDAEFLVNSSTASFQKEPAVAAGPGNRFLVAWSSYVGGFDVDLKAQRYAPFAEPLIAPNPPFVAPSAADALSVTWPALEGFDVASYSLYVDGAATPTLTVPGNWAVLSGLLPNQIYSIRLEYTLEDGRTSPLSQPTQGRTYGQYGTYLWVNLIPADWMTSHYGNTPWLWTSDLGIDADGDGASLYQEFLAGTDPTDPNSVLKMGMTKSTQGLFLSWNTVPGSIYQVQSSFDNGLWVDLGATRFAAGASDSLLIGESANGFFRVVKVH